MKKLAFDIGANNGNFADTIINKFKTVICFEPIPYLVEGNLTEKSKKYGNIKIDPRAVSDKNGSATMFICPDSYSISTLENSWTSSSRFSEHHNFTESINVNVITLEEAIKEHGIPEYIKIDVEGHEHAILNAFTTLLNDTTFCFEWTEEFKNELIQTINHLDKIGYNKFYVSWEDKYLEDKQISWQDKNTFLNFDSFIPERKQLWGMIYFKK
jgi:FkbM family methyltransferase